MKSLKTILAVRMIKLKKKTKHKSLNLRSVCKMCNKISVLVDKNDLLHCINYNLKSLLKIVHLDILLK